MTSDRYSVHPDPKVSDVQSFVAERLAAGAPKLEDVALHFAMSPRTLQRWLTSNGLTYSELLEDIRFRRACEFLQHSPLSVARISKLVGYREQGSFSRAFRRRAGRSPRDFRNEVLG